MPTPAAAAAGASSWLGLAAAGTVKLSLGLGLYIARELVHAHGGRVEVTSTQEAGTTLTLRLPRQQAGARPEQRPAQTALAR